MEYLFRSCGFIRYVFDKDDGYRTKIITHTLFHLLITKSKYVNNLSKELSNFGENQSAKATQGDV
jgi:hypothetical protein